ncbi:MAG: energy transducer TonB [Bacteroidaceae bacterium]|jgi:protein TonB|nr:energy transducer TonB [Bacteroidaceae bacterium]
MSTEKKNQLKGSEHIEVKKSAKANLEQDKLLWVLIGFVMVFAVLFVAFEWTTFEDKNERIIATAPPPAIEEPEVLKEIQIQVKNIVPPPPAAQKPTEVIEIIKDEVDQQETEIISSEDVVVDVVDVSDNGIVEVAEVVEEEEIFQIVEESASFDGLQQYLADNIQYPRVSRDNDSQGRVYVRFVVNADGSVQNVQVLKSSGDKYLDDEAVRVVTNMPKWKPGKQAGKAVRCWFTLPVNFRLR